MKRLWYTRPDGSERGINLSDEVADELEDDLVIWASNGTPGLVISTEEEIYVNPRTWVTWHFIDLPE